MIFVGLRARNQLILVKIIDFRPLVPQKLSVESSINVHQKRVSTNIQILIKAFDHENKFSAPIS